MTTKKAISVLMQAAMLTRARTPMATAVLVKGDELVHAMEYEDGECVLMYQRKSRAKFKFHLGRVVQVGQSSMVSCESRIIPLPQIIADAEKRGFRLHVKQVVPTNLPLLPLERLQPAKVA